MQVETDAYFTPEKQKKKETCLSCGYSAPKYIMAKHIKDFHGGIGRYTEKHFPKYDLLTGDKIAYVSSKQYETAYFAHRFNVKPWYEKTKDLAFFVNLIKARCEDKKSLFIPSEAELLSMNILSFGEAGIALEHYINNLTAYKLKPRFKYARMPKFAAEIKKFIVDTREKQPLKLKNSLTLKLPYGDYCAAGDQKSSVYVERKSLTDFIASFSFTQLDRLKREIGRAKKDGAYIVVLVENNYHDTLAYVPGPYSKQKSNGKTAFQGVRDIMQTSDNVQFLFVDNRAEAVQWVNYILTLGDAAKGYDLQYVYNKLKQNQF